MTIENNRSDLIKLQMAFKLMNEQRFKEAEIVLGHMTLDYPNNAGIFAALSEAYYRQSKIKQAIHFALKAKEHSTSALLVDEILYISKMLSCCGYDFLAIEILKKIDTERININELQNLALQYFKLDQQAEAINLFSSVEFSELTDYSLAMYGISLLYSGRKDEAEQLFNKAIASNRGTGIIYHQISMLNIENSRNERIGSIKEFLNTKISDQEKSSYFFALFNEYNSIGLYPEAFESLNFANNLRVQFNEHDASEETYLFDHYISKLHNVDFSNLEMQSDGRELSPVFIVGLPRTGTTLLESLISKMGDVQPVGEHLSLLQSIDETIGRVISRPIEIANYDISNIDFNSLGDIYMSKVKWRGSSKAYLTDKTPVNYIFLGLIAKAIPSARIVHISKNPMDACFSIYKQAFANESYSASYKLDDIVAHYKNYIKIMSFWKSVLGNRFFDVKYEDLVLQNKVWYEKINDYCRFTIAAEKSERHKYSASTLSASQVLQPVHDKNINAWAKYSKFLAPIREELDQEYTDYMKSVSGAEIL